MGNKSLYIWKPIANGGNVISLYNSEVLDNRWKWNIKFKVNNDLYIMLLNVFIIISGVSILIDVM